MRSLKAGPSSRGAAIVELSLATPLLVVILLGMVDIGKATRHGIIIEGAADAGAAWGAQTEENAADTDRIRDIVVAGLTDLEESDSVNVVTERYCRCHDGDKVDCDDGTCGSGANPRMYVRVLVEKDYHPLFPYPGVPELITLRRESHVRAR